MRRYFTILITLCILGMVNESKAQDIHYSQFYMAPTILNPAMIGVMDCTTRFSGNYRNQWASAINKSAYNTYSASFDQKFTVGRRDYWGLGLNLIGDVAGVGNFQTMQANLGGSFSKYLGGSRSSSHYLVFGAELGGANRSIGYENLRFGSQHDGSGGYDASLISGEDEAYNSFWFMDMGAGLLYFTTFGDNSLYFGGAYHHINRPNVSFYNNTTTRMYSKFTGHAGGEFRIGRSNASIVPGVVTFFQGPSWQLNLGTAIRWYIGNQRYNNQSFQIGVWTRLVNNYEAAVLDTTGAITEPNYKLGADAIILSTKFQYDQFSFGFSYDLNVSTLAENNPGNGSFEFSLMYLICGPERRGVYCPSF